MGEKKARVAAFQLNPLVRLLLTEFKISHSLGTAIFSELLLFIYCFSTIYSRYLNRVISKKGWMWICEAGTIHRWLSGAYLMRSSGHILLSLLPISGWLNRSLINWLLFCAVRLLWFFAYVLMTSVTYGMRKSLCKVMFDMYEGALANFLNVLDWNAWRIFVLEGLLHPHSSIP
jgi:hypothetical protein